MMRDMLVIGIPIMRSLKVNHEMDINDDIYFNQLSAVSKGKTFRVILHQIFPDEFTID